jgi:hypothetical protein
MDCGILGYRRSVHICIGFRHITGSGLLGVVRALANRVEHHHLQRSRLHHEPGDKVPKLHRFLTYSNEAVLPFFLFHQTIIQIVGWFVLPLDMGNLAKFLIIAVVSFPLILILYEVLVRHIGFMRFLFGMSPKKELK